MYKLSPSDFAYLWNDCKHCYYQKVKLGVVSINPDEMKLIDGKFVFTTIPKYHPVKEDMVSFYKLIREISTLLNGDLPAVSETCSLCIYRSHF